jgi:hypothetical protein
MALIMVKRRTRTDDAYDAICLYADENSGVTPSSQELADMLGVCQQRAIYLMMRLEKHGRILWVTKQKYKVVNSEWSPPPTFDSDDSPPA